MEKTLYKSEVQKLPRITRECEEEKYSNAEKVLYMLAQLAYHDALTGLPNRMMFKNRLELVTSESSELLTAILFLDMDHFKPINDTLGHRIGDLLLKAIADRIKGCIRRGDLVARLGGDEFAIILSNITDAQHVARIAETIIETLTRPFMLERHKLSVGVSIGISLYPLDGINLDTILDYADMAMYSAKKGGGNNYRFYDGF